MIFHAFLADALQVLSIFSLARLSFETMAELTGFYPIKKSGIYPDFFLQISIIHQA